MKVDIIAEIGVNHDGDFEKAVKMIIEVARTGVKIVKFQHYNALKLLGKDSPYLEYATRCQFTKEQHEQLKQYCDSVGMEYLVSVFDVNDVVWANGLCKRHKVASRMNQDVAFMTALAMTGKEVIISTQETSTQELFNTRYMFCVTKYPTMANELENAPCGPKMGLSSHCPDIQPTLVAIAKGATLVEHHVKFAGDEEGCDKGSSITFQELAQLHRFANVLEIV